MKSLKSFISFLVSALFFVFPGPVFATPGSYSIKFRAANTLSYNKYVPSQLACPGLGRVADPIDPPAGEGVDQAIFGNGNSPDSNASIAPRDLGLGQIVPFEVQVCANGSTAPENGNITFTIAFSTQTTNGGSFGYDPIYGLYCAFVDPSDPGSANLDGDEAVSSSNFALTSDKINATVNLAGLNDGDCAVVELWVVLQRTIAAGTTGNVKADMVGAATLGASPGNINVGNQATPLLRVREFFDDEADIQVQKTDSPDPVDRFGNLQYSIEVSNITGAIIANNVILNDTLDPDTEFVSLSVLDTVGGPSTCAHNGAATGGTITCDLGFVEPLETVKITVTVRVLPSAPLGSGGTGPCLGTEPLCNTVSITSINDDELANNTASQPTGVQLPGPYAMLTIDKTPDANIVYAGTTVTYNFIIGNNGNGDASNISVSDDKCSPVTFDSYLIGDSDSLLEPGESWKYVCTKQLAVDTTNIGTVSGNDVNTNQPIEAQDTATVNVISPELSMQKSADNTLINPGTLVTYTYRVVNVGDDPVSALTISDDKCLTPVFLAYVVGDSDSLLEPGESWDFTCSQVINQDTTNTATALGNDSLNNQVASPQDQVTVTVSVPTPTATPTATATSTTTATSTPTHTATHTATPSATPTPTLTATATDTATPTATNTASPTYTATFTATPTATYTATATSTHTATSTTTPTPTSTATATDTATPTATNTASPTYTATFTATPTATATETASSTPTPTLTTTPFDETRPTVTPTHTATATATEMPTPLPTATLNPTSTPTPVFTATPVPTPDCLTTNITDEQFALDGGLHDQRDIIFDVLRKIKRKDSTGSKEVKSYSKKVMQETSALLVQNWTTVWSMPSNIITCSGESEGVCANADLSAPLASYDDGTRRLDELLKETLTFGLDRGLLTKRFARKTTARGAAELETNLSVSSSLPKITNLCE